MSYPYHRTTSAEYDDKEGGLTLETISSLLSRLEAGMLVVKLLDKRLPPEHGT